MAIQIGRKKQAPIYNETTTIVQNLSPSTIGNYFKVTQGSSYGWSISGDVGLVLRPKNIGVNSSTAKVTLEAVRDLSGLTIVGNYYTEQNYDKITLTVAGETILNAVSGVKGNSNPTTGSNTLTRFVSNKGLKQGDKIVFTYVKDGSTHHTYESYTNFAFYNSLNYTITTTEITGYEEKILPQNISNLYLSPTKKVIGGWIKNSSAAKQFYGSIPKLVSFTGTYTRTVLDSTSGSYANYSLYTLTSSGNLTIKANAKVWLCGGGAAGEKGSRLSSSDTYYCGGFGGSGGFTKSGTLASGTYSVTIGASGSYQGGTTKVGSLSAAGGYSDWGNEPDGGSAGGAGGYVYGNTTDYYLGGGVGFTGAPTGAGISTYPFGITALKAHCAGGGGGGAAYRWSSSSSSNAWGYQDGCSGGSNGGNGGSKPNTYRQDSPGGDYGGGNGSAMSTGSNATFYGAGGGGGSNNFDTKNAGGSGYQGVAYILINEN